MAAQATAPGPGRAGRPATGQPVPWRTGREWVAQGACSAPDVDADWFAVEETAPAAATAITQAKLELPA